MKNRLRNWFVLFVERHSKIVHSSCLLEYPEWTLQGMTTTKDGVRKIYYDDKVWVEDSNDQG